MGERTEYAPGTFSWADIATTDQEAAKAFYSALFGWEAEDIPVGDGVTYSMMRLGGRNVAAISPQQEQQRAAGMPPVWNSYVTVTSADEAAERAAGLGATVVSPAFDVMNAGRMAVLQDPQGAFFMVWEPRDSIGAGLVNAPGAISWFENVTSDMDAAAGFYGDLFGWDVAPVPDNPVPYLWAKNGEASAAGFRQPQSGEPNYWLVFFATADIDASVARVGELGGNDLSGVIEISAEPRLRIAMVQDPQGGVFGLYEGPLDA
jgi:predicted enzyme related to lactoylglutathione lyase